jgi:hypothetical protein
MASSSIFLLMATGSIESAEVLFFRYEFQLSLREE